MQRVVGIALGYEDPNDHDQLRHDPVLAGRSTLNRLGEELPAEQQDGATPFSPGCTKDLIEEQPFAHRRDLFSRLDLVFMDTTSLYFEGLGGQSIVQHGYSKDHRPDLRQMILAVLIDADGRPVCSEMWPGNTSDVTSLVPVIDRLRRRAVCAAGDRTARQRHRSTPLEFSSKVPK